MKTIKVYSDKDCVIRYAVWPEEPKPESYGFNGSGFVGWYCDTSYYRRAYSKYESALQKAKDESVPFEDQQLVLEVTNLRINKTYLPGWTTLPDCFYDIEFNGEIEVVEVPEYPIDHTSYPPYIKVARLLPSKEETREMSKYSNSEIGSHHWAATLLSFVMRVGEYLESHQHTPEDVKYYSDWGTGLKARAEEVNNYLQSLPDKPE